MELEDWLDDIASSRHEDPEARSIARRLLEQWRSGIVVSPRTIQQLRKLLNKRVICARLQDDGTCGWLRKHAALENVLVPKPGQPVRCHRIKTGLYDACHGFKEAK